MTDSAITDPKLHKEFNFYVTLFWKIQFYKYYKEEMSEENAPPPPKPNSGTRNFDN